MESHMAYSDFDDREGQAALNRIARMGKEPPAADEPEAGHVFMHPQSGSKIVGVRLEPGAILKATDVYPHPDGSWKKAGRLEGQKVESAAICWIRPSVPQP